MSELTLENFRLTEVKPSRDTKLKPERRRKTANMFLCGPIPWDWLSKAARLPGKALHIAIAISHLSRLRYLNGVDVKLSGSTLRDLGVDRHASYRALNVLEAAGLITVKRSSGRCPLVTIVCPSHHVHEGLGTATGGSGNGTSNKGESNNVL